MMDYEIVRTALRDLKFQLPKDGFDRTFNLGIDSAIRRIDLLEEAEAIEKMKEDLWQSIKLY